MPLASPVGITGLGSALPASVLTNQDLEQRLDTSDEWIRTRTGIIQRRIAAQTTATSDLATEAARKALADAHLEATDVDLIIVATVTPDHSFPSTACIVQSNIGATRAVCFDIEAACTGFIYALSIASHMIAAGTYRTAIVIGAEILSRITNYADRSTCILFGDGAGAAILQPVNEGGILGLHLGSDGTGGHLLKLPAGGSRLPASAETVAQGLHYLQMAGSEVFKFAVRAMNDVAETLMADCGVRPEDLALLVPHQANLRIVEAAIKRFGIAPERAWVNIDRYGNMSSASIPVALEEAYRAGRLDEGDLVMLVGFGGGLTWGGAMIRWNRARAAEGALTNVANTNL
ncbi:MAG: beta-ketoacyl-ACP synthase III [Chloroflexota bacterium]